MEPSQSMRCESQFASSRKSSYFACAAINARDFGSSRLMEGWIMKSISDMIRDRPIFSVERNQTVADTVRYMAEKNIGAVPVLNNDRLVGVFSERDVVRRVIARGLNPADLIVGDVMTTKIVVAEWDEDYDSCLKKMQKAHCRHLPVVKGDQLLGLVSLRDLLMIDLDEKERNLEYLQSYIYMVPPGTTKKYSH